MSKKVLVVVDVQNDFMKGGALAYGYPQKDIVEEIARYVKEFSAQGGIVLATRDTHDEDYLESFEGKRLPVKHCIRSTDGWQLVEALKELERKGEITVFDKPTFGSVGLIDYLLYNIDGGLLCDDEIHIIGFCTSICIAANCSLIRTYFPNIPIILHQNLCGDINEESHKAALAVLRNQQIEVKDAE